MRILLPAHHSRLGGIATVVQGLAGSLPAALGEGDELIVAGGELNGDPGPNVRRVDPEE